VSRANCGFASMSSQRRREIASRGGVAAHLKGTAHKWTRQEAREASLKGRQQPRRTPSGPAGARPGHAARPSSFSLDAQPPSPWLESLRKNLEDLFASQKRANLEMRSVASAGEISA
jgi:hypothetical protein